LSHAIRQLVLARRAATLRVRSGIGGANEVIEVRVLGFVELQSAADAVDDGLRDSGRIPRSRRL